MRWNHKVAAAAGLSALLVTTAACAGAGGGGGGGGGASGAASSINVLMVNNPQMVDLQKLTADNFTKDTGITVNYTVLPENDLRDKSSRNSPARPASTTWPLAVQLRDPDLRQERLARPLDDFSPRTRPSTRPTSSSRWPIRSPVGRQALRRAVLRRVVVPDVPQGRPADEGHHDARIPPGSRSPTSPPRSTARSPA